MQHLVTPKDILKCKMKHQKEPVLLITRSPRIVPNVGRHDSEAWLCLWGDYSFLPPSVRCSVCCTHYGETTTHRAHLNLHRLLARPFLTFMPRLPHDNCQVLLL